MVHLNDMRWWVVGGAEWESSSLCRLTDNPKQMKEDPPIKSAI